MANILNRMGYRLRKVVKAKPQKKIPETDAIFENIKEKDADAKSKSTRPAAIPMANSRTRCIPVQIALGPG